MAVPQDSPESPLPSRAGPMSTLARPGCAPPSRQRCAEVQSMRSPSPSPTSFSSSSSPSPSSPSNRVFEAVRRRRRVPFVPQTAKSDCGAACLAMVLAYHGREVRLAELRALLGSGRDGTSALAIKNVAARFGLECEGVTIQRDELDLLDPG